MDKSQIKTEQAFMASLQGTLQQGKKNGGWISREKIAQIFRDFALDETQLQQVEAYLKAHRIVVGKAPEAHAGADGAAAGRSGSGDGPFSAAGSGDGSGLSVRRSSGESGYSVREGSDGSGLSVRDGGTQSRTAGAEASDPDGLSAEERMFLASYRDMLEDIPRLSDSVLEAVKISAMAGEASAQKELSEQMLGSVVDIARLYAGQGVSMEDLVAAGNEALVTGVALLGHLEKPQEVDGELGRRIMDSMEDMVSMMLDDNAMDRELEDLVNLVADKARELADTLGRKVTAAELAREGEVTTDQIAEAVRLTGGKIEDLEG